MFKATWVEDINMAGYVLHYLWDVFESLSRSELSYSKGAISEALLSAFFSPSADGQGEGWWFNLYFMGLPLVCIVLYRTVYAGVWRPV